MLPLAALPGIAQVNDTTIRYTGKPIKYDTCYIGSCGDVVAIEPWISAPSFTFSLEPKEDTLSFGRSSYQPYLRSVVGIDFNYRAVNISLGKRGPIATGQEHLYGKTSYNILKLRLNTSPIIYELYYTKIKGFADRNTPFYDTLRPDDDVYVKRADIQVQYTKLKAIYIFSHKKFSYGAAYSFTEKQRKSKATALAVAHAYSMKATGDSAFFNPGQTGFFGKYDEMKHLDVISVGVGPGVAATFVKSKWFFSLGVYVIADLQYHHAKSGQGQLISEGWRAAAVGDVFLSFGYNGNWFYSGFVLRGDRNMVALPFVNAGTTFYSSVFSVGFRLFPPPIVPKLYDLSPLKYL